MTDKLDPGTEAPASSEEPKAWWMDHVRELVMGPGASTTAKPVRKPAPQPEARTQQAQQPPSPPTAPPSVPPPTAEPTVPAATAEPTVPTESAQPADTARPTESPPRAASEPERTAEDPAAQDQDLQERALEKLEVCSNRVEGLAEELRGAVRGLSDLTSAIQTGQNDLGFDEEPVPGDAGVVGLLGSTACVPVWAIMELLSLNRKSGTLRIVGDRETFTLEILEGDVVHASSDRSTQQQLLGSILVARDKIGVEQLDDFYKRFTPGAGGPSDGESLVSTEDLKSALEAQVQELFNRVHAAETGAYSFFEGEISNVEQRIRMNVTRLLLESARTADELELDERTREEELEGDG